MTVPTRLDDDRLARVVAPFYLQLMGTNAARHGGEVFTALIETARTVTALEVVWLLRAAWRETAMGAWYSLSRDAEIIVDEVLHALASSAGSLTAPPLITAAILLAPDRAVPAVDEYARRDLARGWGSAGFAAAALERLDALSDLLRPSPEDRAALDALLAFGTRVRRAAGQADDQLPR